MRVLRLRAGAALARRLRALRGEFAQRVAGGASSPARPSSASSRASTPTGGSRTTSTGCGSPSGRAGAAPARVLADGGRAHVRRLRAGAAGGVRALARGGLGSTPGHRGRGAPRRRPRADLPEQAAGRALGARSSRPPTRSACARPRPSCSATSRSRGSSPSTCGWSGSCRSARAASPSSCRCRSSRSTRCSGARTASRRSRREENLKHTAAFRLALGRTVANLQASWVKMGLDAATEALRWGVNDLGGTLMEESISRMAGSYHGVRLEPERPDRRRPRGRPAGGRAHDAVRDPRSVHEPARSGCRASAMTAGPGPIRGPGAVRRGRAARGVRRAARRARHGHQPARVLRPDLRGDLPADDDAPGGDLHGGRGRRAGARRRRPRHPVRAARGARPTLSTPRSPSARSSRPGPGRLGADRGRGAAASTRRCSGSRRSSARR